MHIHHLVIGLVGIKEVIPSLVSEADNLMLSMMPTHKLIHSIVFDMDPNSAPGLDGLTGHLFCSCWDIIGLDLCHAVRSFFATGSLFSGLNSNLMVLIPKVLGANSMNKLCPIILSNFIFKIITRILADRLTNISSKIISTN